VKDVVLENDQARSSSRSKDKREEISKDREREDNKGFIADISRDVGEDRETDN
jgi:hypothetical protein